MPETGCGVCDTAWAEVDRLEDEANIWAHNAEVYRQAIDVLVRENQLLRSQLYDK